MPKALHGEVGDVSGVGLWFVGQSRADSCSVIRSSKKLTDMSRCTSERAAGFELLFDIILIGSHAMIAFEVKGLDDFAFLRWNIHDGELFAVGEVLFE